MKDLNALFIEKNKNHIVSCIRNLDINLNNYKQYNPKDLGIDADDSNKIFLKGDALPSGITLIFTEKAKNCIALIGENIKGKNNKFSFKNEGNSLYLGDNLNINSVSAVKLGIGDAIFVGEGVSITSSNSWNTGFNSGTTNNGIIIGDDCLIASEIVIRPADGHLVIDAQSEQQKNITKNPIVIEPYCWLAQRVTILKNVVIGACSIISFGAVVTKSCARFSSVSGVPAKAAPLNGKMWLRGPGREAKKLQEFYKNLYAYGTKETKFIKDEQSEKSLLNKIDESSNSWQFQECLSYALAKYNQDNKLLGITTKYLLDLGHLDIARTIINEFKATSTFKDHLSSLSMINHVEYIEKLHDKIMSNSNNDSMHPFFKVSYKLAFEKKYEALYEHFESNLESNISINTNAENNMILSYAVLALIKNQNFSVNIGILLVKHLHKVKVINATRKKNLLRSIVDFFLKNNFSEFFSLPESHSNHLNSLLHILLINSNKEDGAKRLSKTVQDTLRKNNNLKLIKGSDKIKVAICMSGMMKVDTAALDSLYTNIASPLEADIFFHTWDEIQLWSGEVRKGDFWKRQFKLADDKVPESLKTMDKFSSIFPKCGEVLLSTISRPLSDYYKVDSPYIKSYLCENQNNVLGNLLLNNAFQSRGHFNQLKMFYGIYKSFNMMKDYEEANNIKYDIVIRTRPDLHILRPFDIKKLETLEHNSFVVRNEGYGPSDQFYYCHRSEYEKVASIWEAMIESNRLSPFEDYPLYDAHILLLTWLIKHDINIVNIDSRDYDLAKSSARAKIPGLKSALSNDIKNIDSSILAQPEIMSFIQFLKSHSE